MPRNDTFSPDFSPPRSGGPAARGRRRSVLVLLGAVLIAAAACARGVAVESEPGARYTLEVHNPMPHSMIVAYDDGTGERLLGTVRSGARERFVIADPAARTVTIVATDEDRTHTVRHRVTLRAGEPASVSLNP